MELDTENSKDLACPVDTSVMYFLYKVGIKGHGVFWIGNDKTEGIRQADLCACADRDDYHDWELYEFVTQQDCKIDHKHTLIYTGKRI